MRHWELAFNGDWPAGLVFVAALAAGALAFLFYRRKSSKLSGAAFRTLTALRVLAVALLALFLLQPVLRVTHAEATRGTVAVLLDVSESMSLRDAAREQSRLESGVRLLSGPTGGLLSKLRRRQDVRLFLVDSLAREQPAAESLRDLQPEGKATALGASLEGAVRTVGAGRVSGVVLLTDGISNHGPEPEAVAANLGMPIFPVALGGRPTERGRFYDAGIVGVPDNPELIVNNRARLRFEISHVGLENVPEEERTVSLRLSATDGGQLAERTVTLPAGRGTIRAELQFTPDATGVRRLAVVLSGLPEESVPQNNSRRFTVRVTDPRLRVLIVEGVVRNEYRFLRRTLESDPNLEVTSVVKLGGERFLVQGEERSIDLGRGLPARAQDFKEFDVIVLGDIARGEFAGLQLEMLRDFVDEGGGFIDIGGDHAFGSGGWGASVLADVLPVVIGGVADGHVQEPFAPGLAPEGRRHPALEGCVEFFSNGGKPARVDSANRVEGLKPGAMALLVHPRERARGRPMPVAAAQKYGDGRVMAVTADTTWQWRFRVEGRPMRSPYYRFWRQAVRWLAGRRRRRAVPDRLVNAWSARTEYAPGESVTVEAEVCDPDGEPTEDAHVEAVFALPVPLGGEGKAEEGRDRSDAVSLAPVPLSPGSYQARWQPPVTGLYRGTVAARLDGERLGEAEVEFVVGQANSEFDRVDVDETILRNIAARTGGVFHTLPTSGKIPDQIQQRRRVVLRSEELTLWNAPWFFAAFLAVVTAEWVLRKRNSLN